MPLWQPTSIAETEGNSTGTYLGGREIDEIRMITGLSRGQQAGKAGGHVEPLD